MSVARVAGVCSTRAERSVVRGSSTVHDHCIGQNQVRTGGGRFSGWRISGSCVRCVGCEILTYNYTTIHTTFIIGFTCVYSQTQTVQKL